MEQLKIGELKQKQTKLVNEGEVVNPLYVFASSIDTNLYNDITSTSNWSSVGSSYYDYLFCREQINLLTQSIGFSALTNEDKITSSKYFVVSKSDRDTVLTEQEQELYWGILITQSQNSRFNRWEEAKKYISYRLTPLNSSDLALSTSELCTNYINYNVITKVKDGISGLFDYLKGEGDYVGSGYPSKTYWTQIDQDNIISILENGNY